MQNKKSIRRGLIIVYYGDGKGKTEAAFGLGMRAAGHHFKVGVVQFIKSNSHSGEVRATKMLSPYMEVYLKGIGFVGIMNDRRDREEHVSAAVEALAFAKRLASSGDYYVVILDELLNAIDWNLIKVEQVMDLLKAKNERTSIVLTGVRAYPEIIEISDIVTEMKKVKHIYDLGYLAKLGIDF
ncbi:MAG: cob(I)yrinic acid a,c-diamide adenosyltransferase [Nitrososphaerota archaeon]|nr:cob(I)yrinic acid a,c-diamide adenosyltransferase [Nitrososphaerota archaeon]